jgi:hypothetical protein
MKHAIFAALLLAAPSLARAADAPHRTATPAQAAQQERMRSCNAEARTRSLEGDARKAFLRDCLRKTEAPRAP